MTKTLPTATVQDIKCEDVEELSAKLRFQAQVSWSDWGNGFELNHGTRTTQSSKCAAEGRKAVEMDATPEKNSTL